MARQIAFQISLDGLDSELNELGQLRGELARLNKERKDLLKTQRQQLEALELLRRNEAQNTAAIEREERQLEQTNEALARNTAARNSLNRTTREEQRILDNTLRSRRAERGSIDELRARLSTLTIQYNRLSAEERDNTEAGRQLRNEIRGVSDELRRNESAIGDNRRNVGNYQSALGGLNNQLKVLAAGYLGFTGVLNSVKAFRTQARAVAALNASLEGNEERLEQLTTLASQIQGQTIIGDEQIIQQQAFLVSLGKTNEEIEDLILAAANLSAVKPNVSFESAVQNLAKTSSGLTGELGELIPELRNLTEEELKAGKAVELVNEQFEGQAEALAAADGGLAQLQNQLGDVAEVFGSLILQVIRPFVGLLSSISTLITENSEVFKVLVTAIGSAIIAYKSLTIAQRLYSVENGLFRKSIQIVIGLLSGITKSTFAFKRALVSLRTLIATNPIGLIATGFALLATSFSAFGSSVSQVNPELQELSSNFVQTQVELSGLVNQFRAAQGNQEEQSKILTELIKKYPELSDKIDVNKTSVEDLTLAVEELNKERRRALVDQARQAALEEAQAEAAEKQAQVFRRSTQIVKDFAEAGVEVTAEQISTTEGLLGALDQLEQQTSESARTAFSTRLSFLGFAAALEDAETAIDSYIETQEELVESQDEVNESISENTDVLSENAELIQKSLVTAFTKLTPSVREIEAKISELNKELKDQTILTRGRVIQIQSEIKALKAQRDAILGVQKALKIEQDTDEGFQEDAELNATLETDRKKRESAQETSDELTKIGEGLTNKLIAQSDAETDNYIKNQREQRDEAKRQEEEEIARRERILNTTREFALATTNLINTIFQTANQNRLDQLEESTQREIDLINQSALSEEDKQRRIDQVRRRSAIKEEQLAKKQAKINKAVALSQAIVQTSLAVARALASVPFPANIAAAATTGALGAIQIATIAAQKFAKGGKIDFENGGIAQGASHASGGIPFMTPNGLAEAEGGELIVNKNIQSRPDFVRAISEMNALTGGKRFKRGGQIFQSGGIIPDTTDIGQTRLQGEISSFASQMQDLRVFVTESDIVTSVSNVRAQIDESDI